MDYGQELKRLRFTKKQKEFLMRYWKSFDGARDEDDADNDLPKGVIPAGVSLCGERETSTKLLNALVRKGVITFEHESICTEVTFCIDTPVPGVYLSK